MRIGIIVILLFVSFFLAESFGQKEIISGVGSVVQLKSGQAYLAVPKTTGTEFPAVIIIPDSAGLNPYYVAEADAFAELGILAIAIDFNHGKYAKNEMDLLKLSGSLSPNYLTMVIKAAFDLLKVRKDIKAGTTALVGYGLPGQAALKLMLGQEFKGAVFIGSPPVMDSKELLGIRGALTFIYGEQVSEIPRSLALDFEKMLTTVRIQAETKFIKTDRRRWWDYSLKESYELKSGTATRQLVVGTISKLLVPGRSLEILAPQEHVAPPITTVIPQVDHAPAPLSPTITAPPISAPEQ